MESLQLQALALVLAGSGITAVNGYKMFRNHERRRGIKMARWFGLAAGIALSALYFSFIFQPVSAIPGLARNVFILTSMALLIYSALV